MRRRRLLGVVAALPLLLVVVRPLPTMASGTVNSGQSPVCTPTVGVDASSVGNLEQVGGSATFTCPYPGAYNSQPEGATQTIPGQPIVVGAVCKFTEFLPITVTTLPGGAATDSEPQPFGPPTVFGWSAPYAIIPVGTEMQSVLYSPWNGTGKIAASGACQVPDKFNNGNGPGWQIGCPNPQPFTNAMIGSNLCWYPAPNTTVTSTGLDVTILAPRLLNLEGTISGLINPGTITSQPSPKALNWSAACFYLQQTITDPGTGAPAPFFQGDSVSYQILLASNPDPYNRRVFFRFVITLTNNGVAWDFGDGSGDTTGNATPSPQCQAPSGTTISAAHLYKHWSPAAGFPVTATAQVGITAQEMWVDAAGTHGPIPVNLAAMGVPATITKPATPDPYLQSVLQEEGVGIGG